jgi:hypothetical protein
VATGSLDYPQGVEANLDIAGLRSRTKREKTNTNQWCLREQKSEYNGPKPANQENSIISEGTINYA